MPRLTNHLERSGPADAFDENELARLQRIYDRACEFVGAAVGDKRRKTLAILIFELADVTDDAKLLDLLLTRYRRLP